MMRSDKIMSLRQNAALLEIQKEPSKKKVNSRAGLRSPKQGSPRRTNKPDSPKMTKSLKTDTLAQPEIMTRGNLSRGRQRPASSTGKGSVGRQKKTTSGKKPADFA